jgi:hypothetical protein
MVRHYLASNPDPAVYDFLTHDFQSLTARYGAVAGTAFRGFPSYPQRYVEVLDPQPALRARARCPVQPLRVPRVATRYTEDDLVMRQFLPAGSRRLVRTDASRAA